MRKGEGKKTVMLGPDPYLFTATGEDNDGRYDFMIATITYLQGPPLHIHLEQDDTFFVLEGVLTLQVGDDLFDLHPGDFACAPKGTPHAFVNQHKEPVRTINIMTPGGFDRVLEDFGALPPGPPDPQILDELAQKHKAKFVGPTIADRLGLTQIEDHQSVMGPAALGA
jgi:mannose-6-phosphate isomerase-like protein (cupin superfamily)